MSEKRCADALANLKSLTNGFLKNGAITPAYVWVSHCEGVPSGIKFAAYSAAANRYFACTDSALYSSADGATYAKVCDLAASSPFLLDDGTQSAAVISGTKAVVFKDGTPTAVDLSVKLGCGVMHCGRVFGADGYDVLWSGGNGITDWSQGIDKGGKLTLEPARGKVLNLLEFSGRLVAVRKYGLTVLNMFGSPENFSVGITDTDCDEIYKNTAAVVGGKLTFCSASGLKSFDGSRISPVAAPRALNPVRAVEYAGGYFASCDGGVICLDTDGNSCFIEGEMDELFIKDGVYACCADGIKKLAAGGGYSFESSEINFGTEREKTLLFVEVSGTADISVSNGKYTRLYTGVSGIIRPRLRGIRFTVKAAGAEPLRGLKLCAEVRDAL